MNIKIVLEAKLKESFYRQGVFEYQKRLLGKVEIVETLSVKEYIKNRKNSCKIVLDIMGKQLSSEEFALKLRQVENDGCYNEILFLIGNANGLDSEVINSADFKLSMSKMTFLHQEAVLILIEQIYRAHKILNNEPYHK